jgi:hypothetical protein
VNTYSREEGGGCHVVALSQERCPINFNRDILLDEQYYDKLNFKGERES